MCLVVEVFVYEVVCTVAGLEVVSETCLKFYVSIVGVKLNAVVRSTTFDVVNDCRFDAKCPSLVFTKVEVEVYTEFCCHVVVSGTVNFVVSVHMAPADTTDCFDFEQTRSAFVTTEEVHKVKTTVE